MFRRFKHYPQIFYNYQFQLLGLPDFYFLEELKNSGTIIHQ